MLNMIENQKKSFKTEKMDVFLQSENLIFMKIFPNKTAVSTSLFREIFVFSANFSHSKAFVNFRPSSK